MAKAKTKESAPVEETLSPKETTDSPKKFTCPSCGSSKIEEKRRTALKVSFACGACSVIIPRFINQKTGAFHAIG